MDYMARLEQLEAKLEREGLSAAEKSEMALIRTTAIREARESMKHAEEILQEILRNVEKLKKIS